MFLVPTVPISGAVLLEKLLREAPSKTYVSLLIPSASSAMAVQMRNLRFLMGWQVLGIEHKKTMTLYIFQCSIEVYDYILLILVRHVLLC